MDELLGYVFSPLRKGDIEFAIREAGKSRRIAEAERASGQVHGLGDEIHVALQHTAIL